MRLYKISAGAWCNHMEQRGYRPDNTPNKEAKRFGMFDSLGKKIGLLLALQAATAGLAEAKPGFRFDTGNEASASPSASPTDVRIRTPEGTRGVPFEQLTELGEDGNVRMQTLLDLPSPVVLNGSPDLQRVFDRMDQADHVSIPQVEASGKPGSFEAFQSLQWRGVVAGIASAESLPLVTNEDVQMLSDASLHDLFARNVLFHTIRAAEPAETILALDQLSETLDHAEISVENAGNAERLAELIAQERESETRAEMEQMTRYPFLYGVSNVDLLERIGAPVDDASGYEQVQTQLYADAMLELGQKLSPEDRRAKMSGWLSLAERTRLEAELLLDPGALKQIAEHGSGPDPIQSAAAELLTMRGADGAPIGIEGVSFASASSQFIEFDRKLANATLDAGTARAMLERIMATDMAYQISVSPATRQHVVETLAQMEAAPEADVSKDVRQIRRDAEREDRDARRLSLALSCPGADTTLLPLVQDLNSIDAAIANLGVVGHAFEMDEKGRRTAEPYTVEYLAQKGRLTVPMVKVTRAQEGAPPEMASTNPDDYRIVRDSIPLTDAEKEKADTLDALSIQRANVRERIDGVVDAMLVQEIISTSVFIETYGNPT